MSSNYLQQQQPQQPIGPPGLDPRSPRFAPRGPVGSLPVDTLGCLTRAVHEGGEMRGNTFVTTRGDQISRPHGRCPPHSQIGGPYPKIDEVSDSGARWRPLLNLSQIVTEARAIAEDPAIDGFGHHNPQLGQEDDLFYNALSIDRFMEGFF